MSVARSSARISRRRACTSSAAVSAPSAPSSSTVPRPSVSPVGASICQMWRSAGSEPDTSSTSARCFADSTTTATASASDKIHSIWSAEDVS
jgi:hypothetical protein